MQDYKKFIPDIRFLIRNSEYSTNSSKQFYFRFSLIPDYFVGNKIFIHDGCHFKFLVIKPDHLSNKAGSFFFTKRTGSYIHHEKLKKSKK